MRSNSLFFIGVACLIVGACATAPGPVRLPSPPPGKASTGPSAPSPPPGKASTGPRAPDALIHALATLGVDYRWGGASHAQGFDCSGLVAHVYREAYGVELPRNTQGQSRQGRPVDRSALEPGDLVFYNTLKQPYSHVGIYVGEGRFIHAPRTGAAVRVENMGARYWVGRFDGARRVVD